MKSPTVISETKQSFNGIVYYLCGNYFQKRGKRLHLEVWKYNFGDIPKNMCVHHMDENKSNNDVDNLMMIPRSAHTRLHCRQRPRELQMRAIRAAQAKAPEWHRSEEGRVWHGDHGRRVWDDKEETERVCPHCGNKFMSRDKAHGSNVFCHQNCKAADRRARIKASGQKVFGYKGHVPTWSELSTMSIVDN